MITTELANNKVTFISLEEPNFFRIEVEGPESKYVIPKIKLDIFTVTPEYRDVRWHDGAILKRELVGIKAEAQFTTLPGIPEDEVIFWSEEK